MANYNRSSSASGGGAGYGPGGDAGPTWPDGTSKSTTSRGDRPDPRDPQRPPGVPVAGKNFYPRDGWVTSAPRGGPEIQIGPGSPAWRQGADDVEAKRSLTTADMRSPRRPRK